MHVPNTDSGYYCNWPAPYLPRITTKNRYCMLRFDAFPCPATLTRHPAKFFCVRQPRVHVYDHEAITNIVTSRLRHIGDPYCWR